MALGIDDALAAAAAGISLTDTCVQIVKTYRNNKNDLDIELLIEEVRVTTLRRIDDADKALMQLRRTLLDREVSLEKPLLTTIKETPFWRPFEAHRLKNIKAAFDALADATYSATDDIASLIRCRGKPSQVGSAVVESAYRKRDLNSRLLAARSISEAIDLLLDELMSQKEALQ